ncbi:uncharacterized protein LOC127249343 [Andrographis paniculata]|uniref:uncharacterized protein LOC127249343 n=1 Tax=Andrographis paniculata TaxID=175694 RepID=UPI0021E8714D|nr:uncharacterized protein LOC127249343 [Andrographis paniculata]
MDNTIELAKCECCGLNEDCTQHYISQVKAKFQGKWLCGLCSEAVRDEFSLLLGRPKAKNINNLTNKQQFGVDDAVRAHMSFCRKYNANPADCVADGVRQMLRRRSSSHSYDDHNPSSSSSSSSPS